MYKQNGHGGVIFDKPEWKKRHVYSYFTSSIIVIETCILKNNELY